MQWNLCVSIRIFPIVSTFPKILSPLFLNPFEFPSQSGMHSLSLFPFPLLIRVQAQNTVIENGKAQNQNQIPHPSSNMNFNMDSILMYGYIVWISSDFSYSNN